MIKIKYCCESMKDNVEEDNIIKRSYKGTDDPYELTVAFFIYGQPSYADDGDGCQDDMTESIVITYCPFCGTKLKDMP